MQGYADKAAFFVHSVLPKFNPNWFMPFWCMY